MKIFENVKIGDIIKPEDEEYKHLIMFMIKEKMISWKEGFHRLFHTEKFEGIQICEKEFKTILKGDKKSI